MYNTSNNLRIAKNALFLYFRTFVVIFVSLYVSRLILQLLGETDLGIYNVVGGIVALLSFLQTSLSKSTGRFLTYELGLADNNKKIKEAFSTSVLTHLLLAALIVVLGETVGLWMVNNIIEIPETRLVAANIVYQFSLAVFCVHIIRVPFDAVIIAHENMSIYAYLSVAEAVLQLVLVKLLFVLQVDSLISYSLMMFAISIALFAFYYLYVKKTHPIYHFTLNVNKDYMKKVLSFSWWTLIGGASNTATQQGVSILFNNFVGLVANAALGFANQVNAAVSKFVNSFSTAFNPQLTKLCAQKDINALQILVNRASKFSFCLAFAFAFPLVINIDFILEIWLTNVPQYTTDFCSLILICTLIDATTGPFNTVVIASGKIKNYQMAISAVFLLDLICAFTLLKLGFHPAIVFASRIVTRGFINMLLGFYFSRKLVGLDILNYLRNSFIPVLLSLMIVVSLYFLIGCQADGVKKLIISTSVSTVSIFLCAIFIVMSKKERLFFIDLIRQKILRNEK